MKREQQMVHKRNAWWSRAAHHSGYPCVPKLSHSEFTAEGREVWKDCWLATCPWEGRKWRAGWGVGGGEGNSSGKNVVIKHGNDVDDHHTYTWGSESDCENYELHNYKTILMLTEKFQMKYDVFGRLLKIQMQFIHIRC